MGQGRMHIPGKAQQQKGGVKKTHLCTIGAAVGEYNGQRKQPAQIRTEKKTKGNTECKTNSQAETLI